MKEMLVRVPIGNDSKEEAIRKFLEIVDSHFGENYMSKYDCIIQSNPRIAVSVDGRNLITRIEWVDDRYDKNIIDLYGNHYKKITKSYGWVLHEEEGGDLYV